jgi:hypothetical protein
MDVRLGPVTTGAGGGEGAMTAGAGGGVETD